MAVKSNQQSKKINEMSQIIQKFGWDLVDVSVILSAVIKSGQRSKSGATILGQMREASERVEGLLEQVDKLQADS